MTYGLCVTELGPRTLELGDTVKAANLRLGLIHAPCPYPLCVGWSPAAAFRPGLHLSTKERGRISISNRVVLLLWTCTGTRGAQAPSANDGRSNFCALNSPSPRTKDTRFQQSIGVKRAPRPSSWQHTLCERNPIPVLNGISKMLHVCDAVGFVSPAAYLNRLIRRAIRLPPLTHQRKPLAKD